MVRVFSEQFTPETITMNVYVLEIQKEHNVCLDRPATGVYTQGVTVLVM